MKPDNYFKKFMVHFLIYYFCSFLVLFDSWGNGESRKESCDSFEF